MPKDPMGNSCEWSTTPEEIKAALVTVQTAISMLAGDIKQAAEYAIEGNVNAALGQLLEKDKDVRTCITLLRVAQAFNRMKEPPNLGKVG